MNDSSRIPVWLRWAAGAVLGAAALMLSARQLDFVALRASLAELRPGWAVAGLATSLAGHWFKALRWRVLLSSSTVPPKISRLLVVLLAGQLANLFIPGRAGDWGRALVLGTEGQGRMFTLGTVALEKVLDLLFYAALAALLIVLVPLPDWLGSSPAVVVGLGLAAAALLWVCVRYWDLLAGPLEALLGRLPGRAAGRAAQLPSAAAAALAPFRRGSGLAALFGWSAMAWLASLGVVYWLMLALGLRLPFTAALLLLVVLQAGVSANLSPGAIGIFEFICVQTLALYGVPGETALGFGVALHAVVLLPLLAGAVSILFQGASNAR